MKRLTQSNKRITSAELMFLVMSIIMGIGILSMPNIIAKSTLFSDGWISLIIAGFFSCTAAWICSTLASRYPNQTFYAYSSELVSKPISFLLTCIALIVFIGMAAYELKAIAIIINMYLLPSVPLEILIFSFLLCVTMV